MQIKQAFLTANPCYVANVNKQDSRYTTFQKNGPSGLMLHSVGCAQPSASVFVTNWNKSTYSNACVHAFIDANTGVIYQCMPWNYRAWHCGASGNNSHVGVEMCESSHIKYTGSGASFTITDKEAAVADCKRAYNSAVELFAMLCQKYSLNPLTAICSHKEGNTKGIASAHGDPEHYWTGLGTGYTMDGFRADVKKAMAGGTVTATASTASTTSSTSTTAKTSSTSTTSTTAKTGSSLPSGVQTWHNGTTKEYVYQTSDLAGDDGKTPPIGYLSAGEYCTCFGRVRSAYLVAYKVDGTSCTYKAGYVAYSGGCTF